MLMVTTGINYSSSLLAQNGAHLKAAGEVASGEGHFPAGAILALDTSGDFVKWNPDAIATQNGDASETEFSVGETIVNNSVVVYADDSLKTEGTHYNVNYSTGLITFTAGNVPTNDTGNVVIHYGQELTETNILTCQDYSLFLINIVG